MKCCKMLFAAPMLLWLLVGCGGQPKETGVAVVDSLMSDMVVVEGGVFKEKKLVAVIDSAATRKQQPDEEGMVRLVYLRDSAGRVVRKTRTRTKPISSFLLSRHEVTQELWQAVMGNNPSFTKGKRLPVENVSLADCLDFVERLNEMTGREFRLPTRDEWMWAAHGGVKGKGFAYAGSNQADSVAWTEENSDLHTHDVGLLAANELGLYDMSGNVGEWAVKEYPEPIPSIWIRGINKVKRWLGIKPKRPSREEIIKERRSPKPIETGKLEKESILRANQSAVVLGGTFSVKAEHMVLTPELTDSLALINMRAPAKERHIIYGLRLALTSK